MCLSRRRAGRRVDGVSVNTADVGHSLGQKRKTTFRKRRREGKREGSLCCWRHEESRARLRQEKKENRRRSWDVNRFLLARWFSLIFCGSGV